MTQSPLTATSATPAPVTAGAAAASVAVQMTPAVQHLLRLGDTALIWGQRLAEWCGHAPVLEEDIALANIALDLIGQSRALLTHAGLLEWQARGQPADAPALSEDQLAFLRLESDYRNLTLAELPRGDFARTLVRNLLLATWFELQWQALQASSDAELAAIAGKAVKEARYHREHAAQWVLRLGDGTDESHRRSQRALDALWAYVPEMLETDAVDEAAAAAGTGPRWADLAPAFLARVGEVLQAATLVLPPDSRYRSTAKTGVHSEHMGYILAELQQLQRSYPGGVW